MLENYNEENIICIEYKFEFEKHDKIMPFVLLLVIT